MCTKIVEIWRWVNTANAQDVDLDRILIFATNSLVNENNKNALKMFPGTVLILRSATGVEQVRRANTEHDIMLPEFTYKYVPTGIPAHELQLKKGYQL